MGFTPVNFQLQLLIMLRVDVDVKRYSLITDGDCVKQ